MSKPRKVIRSKSMYGKPRHKLRNTILFILLLALLVGLGYILMKEWAKRFGPNAPSPSSEIQSPISSDTASSESSSDIISSSEPMVSATSLKAKPMPFNIMAQTGDALAEWLREAKQEGYTAVTLELKTEDGIIHYKSQNEMAKQYGAVDTNAIDLAPVIKAAEDAGLTPVARLSALKDPKSAHVRNANSYAYKGDPSYNWLDNSAKLGGKPWLNPYMENARKYIAGLCKEVSDMGMKTILLDNVNFPTTQYTANMGLINEFTTKEKVLVQLVAEAQAAATDAKIIRSFDTSVTAISASKETEAPYENAVNEMGEGTLAPIIRLDNIEKNKQAFCTGLGLVYDAAMPAADIAEALLEQANHRAGGIIPVIEQKDVSVLIPVLDKLKITEYMVD